MLVGLFAAKDAIIKYLKQKVKTLEEALAERSPALDSSKPPGETSNRYGMQHLYLQQSLPLDD